MDKVYEIALLMDFYGLLLTQRQYEILDMHYNNDYSLAEIAEQLSISRQGVYDNIKRGKALLVHMEEKLGLVEKFTQQKNKAGRILNNLRDIDTSSLCDKDIDNLKEVEKGIIEIIES
ncbi:MAG: YlxM family DNA-binding protein [Clostridiaceae bacterium]|nr:YlxM family DNA-binding protein [Clostridiaceae bacterium]